MDESSSAREFPRTDVIAAVEVTTMDGTLLGSGKSRDLSLNGVYVECARRLPVGARCRVTLQALQPEDEIVIEGQVSRVDAGGMAIEFERVPPECVEALQELVPRVGRGR
jgi:hypothetical protein